MQRTIILSLFLVIGCSLSQGQAQEKVLWTFGSIPNDGAAPAAGLTADSTGNLYGTTPLGGTNGQGTIFELSPQTGGAWSETVLYNFCENATDSLCLDGADPEAGLSLDSAGNIYGTTLGGGTSRACGSGDQGCGTVFELSPPLQQGGPWTESVLYAFCSLSNCLDGASPRSRLVFDSSSNLYGTTETGGSGAGSGAAAGVVFELSAASGRWTETVLYNFCSQRAGKFCTDGSNPQAGVVFDQSGNLYGTTVYGGGKQNSDGGLVYKLSPVIGGWAESVLLLQHKASSYAGVSFDSVGNLYGTTTLTVFQLNKSKQTMRSGTFAGSNGYQSMAGALVDGPRNALFGTTYLGGANSLGTVWEVTPSRQLVAIYSFCSDSNCPDGRLPIGDLVEDQSGNIFGTAQKGGTLGHGVVFQITP